MHMQVGVCCSFSWVPLLCFLGYPVMSVIWSDMLWPVQGVLIAQGIDVTYE